MTESGHGLETSHKTIFETALNRQGHPFQYGVIRRAQQLHEAKRSPWVFEVSEFPVEVQSYPTRIDFVLSLWREVAGGGPFLFLVAECKRANPSLHDWFFARAPYVRRGSASPYVLVESVRREGHGLSASFRRLDWFKDIYHVAVEVKGAAKGDAGGTGRGAIEEAATQVIRGVNGLIECFSKNQHYLTENRTILFIPVLFTTAKIWATDADIASDITTGHVTLGPDDVIEKPWLWLQYHVSPGLQHAVDRQVPQDGRLSEATLGNLLEFEYARTIAVVGSGGIDDFLTSHHWTS